MSQPTRASDTPIFFSVESGKKYFWCSCGKSRKQPICDGSHSDTDFTPIRYDATESKDVMFCGCKGTKTPPICDGSHNKK